MRPRSKSNKVIDISLAEEKFYFPTETIKGTINVQPKNSIKVNPIVVKFSGSIIISGKDKEVIPLFQEKKSIIVNNGKSKLLEAKQYSFPFEFTVPNNLPSAMDFKMVKISYKLTAILSKPMIPESLCPKVDYPVLILEKVDVTEDKFTKSIEKQKEVLTVQNGKCHAKLSIPRSGFTRGETIPVNIVINTLSSFRQKDALILELVRKVKIHSSKNVIEDEAILKSGKFDINIIGPYNFSQSINGQLLIKTTPPSIHYKSKVLNINYKIRAKLSIGNNFIIELPITIGTWPRADIPIDDDDDDDIIQNFGELMMSDESDDDWIHEQEELEFKKYESHRRSNSNGSATSMSSWSTGTDHRMSISNNSNVLDYRSTLPPVGYNKTSSSYLNRSSSTPDLLQQQQQQQQQQNRARVLDPTLRASYYDQSPPSPLSNHSYHHYHHRSDDIPNHTLTMISSPTSYHNNVILESSEDDYDEEDEDDLFSIIEKKKKREEKEMKKRQKMIMTM